MTRTASTSAANPAVSFFGRGPLVRGFGLALRAAHSLAPRMGTHLALRLFFTPLPSKLAARRRALPPGWQLERWPFEQGSIAVYRRPEVAADRPVVLLLHGWAGDAGQMRPLAEALLAQGLNPVLMEQPGHGRSDGWRSTLPQFVRGLWAASARLGPLHGVVAHSMGALAATHAAASGLPVQRLVLLAPAPSPARVLQWFAGSFGLAEALPQRMRTVIERREGMPLDRFEPAWLAPRVQQPTLVVHDQDDRASPLAIGQGLAQAMPDARLLATEGLGHRRVLADPTVLQAVAEHLRPTA